MKKVLLLLLVVCLSLTALPCISNTNSRVPMRVMHNRTRAPTVMPDVEQEDSNSIYPINQELIHIENWITSFMMGITNN